MHISLQFALPKNDTIFCYFPLTLEKMSHFGKILFAVFLVVLSIESGHAQEKVRKAELATLDSLLSPSRYDRRLRPAGLNETETTNEPVIVTLNMLIRSIDSVDDTRNQFSTQITFRQKWNDARLKFDDKNGSIKYLTLREDVPKTIWTPDTFFLNEKQAHVHSMMNPNVMLRVYPNGDVLYSTRISATFACAMNLKDYPVDTQTCSIKVESYAYSSENIVYAWKEVNPVQVPGNLNLGKFTLTNTETDDCTSRTRTGEYSCALVNFAFKRQFNPGFCAQSGQN